MATVQVSSRTGSRSLRYLRSLAQLWRYPGVSRLRLRINPRLTATLARVLVNEKLIEFSKTVARLDARNRREMICHEAAHFVVWQRHGAAARPHGPEWAALVRLAGFEPKASRVRCGQSQRRLGGETLFRHKCPVCHFSKHAARRMPRWRCPECRAIGLPGRLQNRTGSSTSFPCPRRLCPFCSPDPTRVFFESDLVFGIWDAFAVSDGHALVVTRRHVASWFDATPAERAALTDGIAVATRSLYCERTRQTVSTLASTSERRLARRFHTSTSTSSPDTPATFPIRAAAFAMSSRHEATI